MHTSMEAAAPVSKKALKRQARMQAAKEHRVQKKKAKKEEARLARDEAPPAERVRRTPLRHEPAVLPYGDRKQLLAESLARAVSGTLIIDLDFEGLMTEQERKSMGQQLSYCYSANRHAPRPFNLELRGLTRPSAMADALAKLHVDEWRANFTEGYFDGQVLGAHAKERVVYLSPEAPDELDGVDDDAVYVVGGFVDRNRHKGASLQRASELGVRSARLPLDGLASLSKAGFSKVLTTKHVVDLMLEVKAGASWDAGLARCLPKRKMAAAAEAGDRNALVHCLQGGWTGDFARALAGKRWSVLAAGLCAGVAAMAVDVRHRGDCTRLRECVRHRAPLGLELVVLACAPDAPPPAGLLVDLMPVVTAATRIVIVPSSAHPGDAEREWTADVIRAHNAETSASLAQLLSTV